MTRTKTDPPARIGRPPLDLDPELLETLAGFNLSMAEIAAVAKCSVDTLERRFAEVIESGRANGRASLKRRQFSVAMDGNPTMLIWLGKVMLGQKETSVLETREMPQVVVE